MRRAGALDCSFRIRSAGTVPKKGCTKKRPRRSPGPFSLLPIYDPLPLLVQALFTHFTLPAAVSDPPLPVAVSVTVRFPFAV
jgi:hypothetical protein